MDGQLREADDLTASIQAVFFRSPYESRRNLYDLPHVYGSELRDLLGIPKEIKFGVMIPIGWPQNDFVKVKRKPIASVIHWDKWSD